MPYFYIQKYHCICGMPIKILIEWLYRSWLTNGCEISWFENIGYRNLDLILWNWPFDLLLYLNGVYIVSCWWTFVPSCMSIKSISNHRWNINEHKLVTKFRYWNKVLTVRLWPLTYIPTCCTRSSHIHLCLVG